MAGGEHCQQQEQEFTGDILGFPEGKSEQDASALVLSPLLGSFLPVGSRL